MSAPPPYTATYGNEDLDVYAAPTDSRSRPLIVFVHGGAWRSESKEEHRDLALRLRDLTACPVAVLDYRLTASHPRPLSLHDPHPSQNGNELKHPAHAKDVLDALHFLIRWPDGAPFDHTRLFLVAHSAGAHILTSIFLDTASCASYLPPHFLKPDDSLLRAVQGIALASGIYDLQMLMRSFPHYEKAFLRPAFRDPFDFWNTTRYPLHPNALPIRWHIIHSSGDSLVDLPQSEAIFHHLSTLYDVRGWGAGYISKDWVSLATDHYYVKDLPFAQLVADWVNRHIMK